MKYRRILFLIPLLICCGWTSNYSLEYNGKTFKEIIVYNFEDSVYNLAKQYENMDEGKFLEVELISEDIYGSPTKKYKKTFSEDNRTVTLTANYNYEEFKDSYQITSCFENYEFEKSGNKYIINLSGEYYCNKFSTLDLMVKTYNLYETNTNEIDENLYRWYLSDNTVINIVLRNNSDIINICLYVVPILLFIALAVLIIFIRNKRVNS